MRAGVVGFALAAGLVACGSKDHPRTDPGGGPEPGGGGAPSPLAVRGVEHLHVARASIGLMRLVGGADGDTRVIYALDGPPAGTTGITLHLERRRPDLSVLWERAIGLPARVDLRVTPLGNTLLAVGGGGGRVDLGMGELAFTVQAPAAIAKLLPDGSVDWQVPEGSDVKAFATDANGSSLVALGIFYPSAPAERVAKVRFDGTALWEAALPSSANGPVIAAAPDGGVVVGGSDAPAEPAGGFLALFDADGKQGWTRDLEHLALRGLVPRDGGGWTAWASTDAGARWAGEPVPEVGTALLAIRADGTLASAHAVAGPGEEVVDVAVAPSGRAVVATSFDRYDYGELHLGFVEADGATRFTERTQFRTGTLRLDPGAMVYDGKLLTVGLAAATPFELAGTRVVPFDGVSPVLMALGER